MLLLPCDACRVERRWYGHKCAECKMPILCDRCVWCADCERRMEDERRLGVRE